LGFLHIRPQRPLSTNGSKSNPLQAETVEKPCKVLASRGATIVCLPLLNVTAAYAGIVGRLQNSIGSRRQVGVPA
jgi:hypothetical protein